MNYSDTTVIIPTLNEEKNISFIISLIRKDFKKINILVVDDGSKDRTRKLVKKAKLLDRTDKKIKGLSISIMDGINISDTKYIIVMDADLQHPVDKIKDIRTKLHDHDIVIATRKTIKKWPLKRRIISKVAIILGSIRLSLNNINVKDPVSGFFGIRTELAKKIIKNKKIEKQGYKILFDILKYSKKPRIAEVYYDFMARSRGSSKIGLKHILAYSRSLFK